MSRFEADSRALKRPALVLAVVAIFAALLLWASYTYKAHNLSALRQARAELDGVRNDYQLAQEADGILRSSQQRYRQLLHRGFIGPEPRLQWIESLRETGREHHLYNLKYNLRQRQRVALSGMETTEHYQIYTSAMQLRLDLAHEVDLLRYFADLNHRQPAVYQIRACSLKPTFADSNVALDAANVNVKCELLWYTVDTLPLSDASGDLL